MEKCDFNRQFSFDLYLLNILSNFIKMATFKSCKASLSNVERISSVDQILSTLQEVKVRLPFFLYTYKFCIVARKVSDEPAKHW